MKKVRTIICVLLIAVLATFGINPPAHVNAAEDSLLVNGGFEDSIWGSQAGWANEVSDNWSGIQFDNKAEQVKEGEQSLHFYSSNGEDFALSPVVSLEAGTYTLSGYFSGASATPKLIASVKDAEKSVTLSGWGVWDEGILRFTLAEAADVTITVAVDCNEEGWGDIDDITLVKSADEPGEEPGGNTGSEDVDDDSLLANPDFERDVWGDNPGWTIAVDNWGSEGDVTAKTYNKSESAEAVYSGNNSFNFWSKNANTMDISQEVTLPAGEYEFAGFAMADKTEVSVYCDVNEGGTPIKVRGWPNWREGYVTFTLSEETKVKVGAYLKLEDDGWGYLDNFYLGAPREHEPEKSPFDKVNINPINGLSPDFMRGVDISSVASLEAAGVEFYDTEGEPADFFAILEDAGVNWVRLRIWNDPYDSEGNGYGGGNNDLDTTIALAKRATDHNMKIFLDFHYSDFWASPSVQIVPKAWTGHSVSQLCKDIDNFTTESLNKFNDAGIPVDMVQIGNETTRNFCGHKGDWDNICKLMIAGCNAVKTFDPSIKTMIHFGGSPTGEYVSFLGYLKKYKVNYDVVGISWYPFYNHGTLSNLSKYMNTIANTYGKEVVVAENSFPSTFEDSDGHPETFGDDKYFQRQSNLAKWSVSPQGQAEEVRDTIEAISKVSGGKGIGYFYWEPAWISVGDTTGLTGDTWQKQFEANQELWNKYGCGWASKYAQTYDGYKSNAQEYWGGSSWDNQAMFAPSGQAYDSVNVFKYIYQGNSATNLTVKNYSSYSATLKLGSEMTDDAIWSSLWRDSINCTMSDGTTAQFPVMRLVNSDVNKVIAGYKKNSVGKYTVHGILNDAYHYPISVTVKIVPKGTQISKLTAGKSKMTVTYKKQRVATTGYQIQYSKSKEFTSAKTVTIKSNKTTSKTIKKLKKKTDYYVRVRTYKTVSGTKYYSSWSTVKKVTIK